MLCLCCRRPSARDRELRPGEWLHLRCQCGALSIADEQELARAPAKPRGKNKSL